MGSHGLAEFFEGLRKCHIKVIATTCKNLRIKCQKKLQKFLNNVMFKTLDTIARTRGVAGVAFQEDEVGEVEA